jgi:RNA polymerase primary sigma factor
MASSPKVTPQKDKVPEKGGSETPPDSALLGLSDAAVKKLIRTAKKRGYVTHDQIDSLSKEVNSKQIQDVLAMFSEMGMSLAAQDKRGDHRRHNCIDVRRSCIC